MSDTICICGHVEKEHKDGSEGCWICGCYQYRAKKVPTKKKKGSKKK